MKKVCPKYNTDDCFRFLRCEPEDGFFCPCEPERYY